jgi:hypothetical protein
VREHATATFSSRLQASMKVASIELGLCVERIFRHFPLSSPFHQRKNVSTTSIALCTEKRERERERKRDDIPRCGPVEARNSRIDDLPLLRNEACMCHSNYGTSESLMALSKRQHLKIYVNVCQSRDVSYRRYPLMIFL